MEQTTQNWNLYAKTREHFNRQRVNDKSSTGRIDQLASVEQELGNDFEPVRPNMELAMMPMSDDFDEPVPAMRTHNSSQPMISKNLQKHNS